MQAVSESRAAGLLATEPRRPATRNERLAGAALVLALVVLAFSGLGMTLTEPDEGRYVEIPREMIATGDFVTPRLDGVLYLEKPPLYYWMNAASLEVFGHGPFAARVWSAALGLLGVAVTFRLARGVAGVRVALYAAAFLGTAPLWVVMAHLNTIDMTLTFLTTMTLACFWWAHDGTRRLPWIAMFAASALAVLCKGLVGAVVPGAVVFLYVLATRRWSMLKRVPWLSGLATFAVVAAPWHVLAARATPQFLWFYFVREHVLRYLTDEARRVQPFWFFFVVVGIGALPWIGLLPAAGSLLARREARDAHGPERRDLALFAALWAGFVIAFFSVSKSKLIPYVLPAFPPLAILLALTAEHAERLGGRERTLARVGMVVTLAAVLALCVPFLAAGLGRVPAFSDPGRLFPRVVLAATVGILAAASAIVLWVRRRPRLGQVAAAAATAFLCAALLGAASHTVERYSTARIADWLDRNAGPDADVFGFRFYPQSLPFQLRRTIGVVEKRGELEFGIGQLDPEERLRRFPDAAEFALRWQQGRPLWLVVERDRIPSLPRYGIEPYRTVLEEGKYVLVTNRRRIP